MTTIAEIARRVRVSTATVSHLLNRTKPVSRHTRALLETIARELGILRRRVSGSDVIGKFACAREHVRAVPPDLKRTVG